MAKWSGGRTSWAAVNAVYVVLALTFPLWFSRLVFVLPVGQVQEVLMFLLLGWPSPLLSFALAAANVVVLANLSKAADWKDKALVVYCLLLVAAVFVATFAGLYMLRLATSY